ncbi:MAG TPA: CoA transferase [Candidatus Angelobacter sp.]|nr:CoA transferase [Candidatus Angelobacter sp.]
MIPPALTDSNNLLSGIRVIDCGTYIAGPAAAVVMSDFGAEVIKIERPPHGDPYRYLSLSPGMPVSDQLYCWMLDARNKKSIALNLENDQAREALLKLVASADVFITNFQPQLIRKFRLEYETLQAINSRLIYAQVTGYGEAGDECDKPGYDQTAYWAKSGLMFSMHNADAEPCRSPTGFGDHPTAMTVFGSVMLGLYRREITGQGMKLSTSLMANGAWSNACMIQAALAGAQFLPRTTRKSVANALVNHYVTRDQKRFLTCCLDPKKDWSNFCKAIERPELIDHELYRTPELRHTNASTLIATIDEAIAAKDMAEWETIFKRYDLIWAPVLSNGDVTHDLQMAAGGVLVDTSYGPQTVSSPFHVEGVDKMQAKPAPQVGEHTAEILRSVGYNDQAIADLHKSGAAALGTSKAPAMAVKKQAQ